MARLLTLRPAEVAQALSIGRTKTYSLIASGVIPSVRIGGSVRVPVDALNQWVHDHTSSSGGFMLGAIDDDEA